MAGMYTTGFKESDGMDIGDKYLEKAELIDRYPFLVNTMKSAGLWLWGTATNGVLANGSTSLHASSPAQTVSGGTNWKQVDVSEFRAAAIKSDGSLWSWGTATLGNNANTGASSPVQTISGGANWKQVTTNADATAAIKTDGTLWLWGLAATGMLGNDSSIARSSPVQTISGGTNWKQVSLSNVSTSAIKTDGSLWLWGRGTAGQLGNNNTNYTSSPVQTVSGGTNWKQVSGSTAIKTDGTLWLWGEGTGGILGNDSSIARSSPVQTISGGTNWKQVSARIYATAAIKTDGTLWVWGLNSFGMLGNNSTVACSSPVQTISGGTNWKQVSAGNNHMAAIKTDGSLWLWGCGTSGQLGNNSSIACSSPVQTISSGTNWKQVSAGAFVVAAIREFEDF